MVLSMEIVLPNGDIIHTSAAPKHAAGPDLNQIFIGSEGTLGIITKAQIRIYEQPETRRSGTAHGSTRHLKMPFIM